MVAMGPDVTVWACPTSACSLGSGIQVEVDLIAGRGHLIFSRSSSLRLRISHSRARITVRLVSLLVKNRCPGVCV